MSYLEEFDKNKTKVLKYIIYKRRTENEVRTKFKNDIEENMLEDIIEYLKEAKYIDDNEYIERTINKFKILKALSLKELQYKLIAKGLSRNLLEDYFSENREELTQYEINSAIKIIQKKQKEQEEQEIKTYLLKKGYKSENINKAFDSIEEID